MARNSRSSPLLKVISDSRFWISYAVRGVVRRSIGLI